MSPLYVYAIVDRAEGGDLGTGIGAEELEMVAGGTALAAVAGRLGTAPGVTAESLRAHDDVVRRMTGRFDAVLPARFGSLAPDADAIRAALEDRAPSLSAALARVRGREQMTLRVFATGEKAGAAESPVIAADDAGPGARYLSARAREGRGADVPGLRSFLDRLASVVVAEAVEAHQAPPLAASVYHLIGRGTSVVYRDAVRRAGEEAAAVRIVVSGPWPPYAFAADPALAAVLSGGAARG